MDKLRDLRVRSKLVATGVLVCFLFAISTLAMTLTLTSSSSLAERAETANSLSADATHAHQQWLSDDDQSNMYVALVSLRKASLMGLAQTSYQQAVASYGAATKALAAASALATGATEVSMLSRIGVDLATYNGFTNEMHQAVVSGHVASAVEVMTVGNSDVSNRLVAEFARLDQLEATYAQADQSGVVSRDTSGLTMALAIAVLSTVVIVVSLWWVVRSIVRPLDEATRVLDLSAKGDLRPRATVSAGDELGQMAKSLNQQLDARQSLLRTMADMSHQLAASSEELTAISTQLANGSEETSAQATTVAAAAEQVSVNVGSVAAASEQLTASIHEIARSAANASRVAAQGVEVAQATTGTVTQLNESSNQIGEVVKLITAIAQQTNLLALNATIEAARAGEAGRGFAIVASEVKELAKETAKATDDITRTVENLHDGSQATIEAITQIDHIMAEINQAQSTIAAAVEEQTATTAGIGRTVTEAASGSGEIARNIAHVASGASETTIGAATTRQAADELSRMANRLETLIGGYQF